MSELTYAIVIATRNRPEALRLSIPRMLGQSRRPAQLIVIDSSDDHLACRVAVEDAVGSDPVDLTILESERGLTRQRNKGLELVKHPVVFYPDDDSIWFPEVAEEKMKVYEHDEKDMISAVCGLESKVPPEDFLGGKDAAYTMKASDRLQQRIGFRRTQFERKFFPDPAKIVGEGYYSKFNRSQWYEDHEVVPVEWMTGFRMSFRTKVIQEVGFDQEFNAYSLFEDIDASFGAWARGCVVAAKKAKIYHYKSPERRGDGRRLGAEQLLNKAYIVAKHTPQNHPARKLMLRFARYKKLQYRIAARDEFGKQRLAGARSAYLHLPAIMNSPPDTVISLYREAVTQCAHASQ